MQTLRSLIDAARHDFEPMPPTFTPMRIIEVEIGAPMHDVPQDDPETGKRYTEAFILARMYERPLGIIEAEIPDGGIPAAALADRIWQIFGTAIGERLQQEGLAAVTALTAEGLPDTGVPTSLRARREFLADAPFTSVAIATRNRPAHVVRCVRSLLAMEYPNFEIIVVDNAPTTRATADIIAELFVDEPRVRYVREDYPGPAMARTRGLLEARAAIVAYVDDDVVVDRHWLSALVQGFQAGVNVACVTGLVLPMELETAPQGWIKHFGNLGKGFTQRTFDLAEHRADDILYPYVSWKLGAGASMAFRVEPLRAIGGFDPLLGPGGPALSGEEMSAYFQLLIDGYQVVYEPAALLRHLDYRDYANLRRQTYGYGVGLFPYLVKCLCDNPRLFRDFVTRIPRGMWTTRKVISQIPPELRKWEDYSRDLMLVRRKGMLYGPVAFIRSWLHKRRLRRRFGRPDFGGHGHGAHRDASLPREAS